MPFPSPGGLPHPGIKPGSPVLAGKFFTTGAQGSPDSLDATQNSDLENGLMWSLTEKGTRSLIEDNRNPLWMEETLLLSSKYPYKYITLKYYVQ